MTEADWNSVVKDLGPALLRYFSASFPGPIASDLVQEVLIRLVRKFRSGDYRPEEGSLRMFAFGIAHYVRLEGLKATSPEIFFPQVEDYENKHEVNSTDENIFKDRSFRLRRAISNLGEIERQIILLHIDDELTLIEIGEILKLPLGTVKSHVHRAKIKLRENLLFATEGVQNG